jgi:hypothetical protein
LVQLEAATVVLTLVVVQAAGSTAGQADLV